jgi:hypothetical protein
MCPYIFLKDRIFPRGLRPDMDLQGASQQAHWLQCICQLVTEAGKKGTSFSPAGLVVESAEWER